MSLATVKAAHIPRPTGPKTAMVYDIFSWKADSLVASNRADAILLACLRSGHVQLPKAYAQSLSPTADAQEGVANTQALVPPQHQQLFQEQRTHAISVSAQVGE